MYGELTPCLYRASPPYSVQCTCSPIHSPRGYKGCGHRQPWKGWNGNGPMSWLSWLASKRTARNCTQPSVRSQVSQVLSCWGQVRDLPMPSRPWAHPAESPGARHVPLTIMQRTYLCHAAHYACPSLAHTAATHAQLLCLRLKCRAATAGSTGHRPLQIFTSEEMSADVAAATTYESRTRSRSAGHRPRMRCAMRSWWSRGA